MFVFLPSHFGFLSKCGVVSSCFPEIRPLGNGVFNCYVQIILVLVVHKKLNNSSPLAHAQDANEVSECEDGVFGNPAFSADALQQPPVNECQGTGALVSCAFPRQSIVLPSHK